MPTRHFENIPRGVHFQMPASSFDQLRRVGQQVGLTRSELIREGVMKVIKKYSKTERDKNASHTQQG